MRLHFLGRDHAALHALPADEAALPAHLLCLSFFAVLYFGAFLSILVLRTTRVCVSRMDKAAAREDGRTLVERLEAASNVLFYVPALCILVLATRIWSLHTSSGELADWVVGTMYAICGTLFAQYLCTVLDSDPSGAWTAPSILRTIAAAGVNAGVAGLVLAILCAHGTPSTAMQCIGLLTSMYFAVHMVLAVRGLIVEGAQEPPSKAFAQVEHVKETLTLLPMVCIVLLSIRARAHEVGVQPSHASQGAMLVLTASGVAQVLAVLGQALAEGRCWRPAQTLLSAVEAAAIVSLYGGVAFLLGDLVLVERGQKDLPTAIQCITVLAALYFLAYFSVLGARWVQYVTFLYSSREDYTKSRAEKALQVAQDAVVFVPMLCVLFIALRLRAETLGKQPVYTPYAMWTCVTAQLLHGLLEPIAGYVNQHVFEGPASEGAKYWAIALALLASVVRLVVYVTLTALLTALWSE